MIPEVDNSKEAAAYRMLRQVLHNHITTQALTCMSALTAVGLLLGHLARHIHGMGYDLQRFSADTLDKLGGQLLARLREGDVPLVHLPAPALTGERTAKEAVARVEKQHAQELGDALWRLIKETSEEQRLTPVGARWMTINLAADVLYGTERLLHPDSGRRRSRRLWTGFIPPLPLGSRLVSSIVAPFLTLCSAYNLAGARHSSSLW